jgi:hypothetical protein
MNEVRIPEVTAQVTVTHNLTSSIMARLWKKRGK